MKYKNLHCFLSGSNGWIGSRTHTLLSNGGAIVTPMLHSISVDQQWINSTNDKSTVALCFGGLAHQNIGVTSDAMMAANAYWPAQLAVQASRKKIDTFVLLSSAKVLGDQSLEPATTDHACAPIGAYAESKLEGERLVSESLKGSQTRLIIVRPPLVYGPKVEANFLALLNISRSGFPLPFANLHALRSMVYLDNLIDATLQLCLNREAQGVFHICDDLDRSTSQWIRALRSELGLPHRLFNCPTELLSIAATLTGKQNAIDKVLRPFRLSNVRLTQAGVHLPFSVEQATAQTVAWLKNSRT